LDKEVRLRKDSPFFNSVYESGIIDVWFKGIAYSLVTTAFIYLYLVKNISLASPLFFVSYMFMTIQVVHGSRPPYEFMKEKWVYNRDNKVVGAAIYSLFLYVRLQIIASPLLVLVIGFENGKLPI
jgi:hypothetical protein